MSIDNNALLNQLLDAFEQPLPGKEAQFKMAHFSRKQQIALQADHRKACTLLLLYPKDSAWHIVFIERISTNKKDKHGGQISFPGGQVEKEDESLAFTALREAQEEVGVNPDSVRILGQMTELYIPVSNFLVYPFVGISDEAPSFVAQVSEVKNIIEAPLSLIEDPATKQLTTIQIREDLSFSNVPFFNVQEKVIWGATAMMLSEFLELLAYKK